MNQLTKSWSEVTLKENSFKKGSKLYEGKAKIVYATDKEDVLIQEFKDDASAFDGKKKGKIKASKTAAKMINHEAVTNLPCKALTIEKKPKKRFNIVNMLGMMFLLRIICNHSYDAFAAFYFFI